jgi:hypothetical protein
MFTAAVTRHNFIQEVATAGAKPAKPAVKLLLELRHFGLGRRVFGVACRKGVSQMS